MSRDRHGIKFSRPTAKRILEVGRFVEQQPRNRVPPPAPPVDFAGFTMLKVTTACNPMTGTSPGKNGRGKIQEFSGTFYLDLTTTVYPIVNDTEKTVAVGAYVGCIPGPGGMFHIVVVDKCSNLS